MNQKKTAVENLAKKYFDVSEVRIDSDVLTPQLARYKLSIKALELLFQSISKHLWFFKKELAYSLQLSNLLFFEMDARKGLCIRGSAYRCTLTKKYKDLLFKS